MTRQQRRLFRQIEVIKQTFPAAAPMIDRVLRDRWRMVRLPVGGLLIVGSVLAVLPAFGLWMLPLGLLLLAVDVPVLQPLVSNAMIRLRRRFGARARNWRAWLGRQAAPAAAKEPPKAEDLHEGKPPAAGPRRRTGTVDRN